MSLLLRSVLKGGSSASNLLKREAKRLLVFFFAKAIQSLLKMLQFETYRYIYDEIIKILHTLILLVMSMRLLEAELHPLTKF